MQARMLQHEKELMPQDYSACNIDYTSPDMFDSKFAMPNSGDGDLDYYDFDHASHGNTRVANDLSAYDMPLSPTMSGNDMFFNHDARPLHINPAATWNGSEQSRMPPSMDRMPNKAVSSMAKTATDYSRAAGRLYGQITPPSENDDSTDEPHGRRADSGIGQEATDLAAQSSLKDQAPKKTASLSSGLPSSKRARGNRQMSEDDGDIVDGVDGGKREKYREKNRVAAAKCRAKKKTHVDDLEDTHRTQSVLNTALKQTEKSLRDELSFWRTQALQHTFCSCRAIQDYNMRKAQNLAAESILGNAISKTPAAKSRGSVSKMSSAMQPCRIHSAQSQTVSGMDLEETSPVIAAMNMDKVPGSFAATPGVAVYQTDLSKSPQSSEAMMQDPMISSNAAQELKNFVSSAGE